MYNTLGPAKQYGDPDLVVAVVDKGFDVNHEDLYDHIMPPDGPFQDPSGIDNSHGTNVAGVLAAISNNGTGVAGTAGGVTMLPIKIDSATAQNLAEALNYAVAKGAKIVNSSVDFESNYTDWTEPTYLAALDNMAQNGVLHINAAGNWDFPNQHFRPPQSLHVASTDEYDVKMFGFGGAGFARGSAYGTGIDISAPGVNILTTYPDNAYGSQDGTSFAAPNLAGAAALVWTAHPEWTSNIREKVAAMLIGTADDIDPQNPDYVGMLGSGRINSYRAVSETLPPPKFDRLTVMPGEVTVPPGEVSLELTHLRVELANVFDKPSIENRDAGEGLLLNFQLLYDSDGDGSFEEPIGLTLDAGHGYDIEYPLGYDVGTNDLYLAVEGGELAEGHYQFTAFAKDQDHPDGLQDPFGSPLDGNGNGITDQNDDFVLEFRFDRIDASGGGAVLLEPKANGQELEVKINQVASQSIPLEQLNSILIEGSPSVDTFTIEYFGPRQGQVLIRGRTGPDQVIAYGSPADDYFFADPLGIPIPLGDGVAREPQIKVRTEAGYRVLATSDTVLSSFTAHGEGGNDRAYWMGSEGDDTFSANSILASLNSFLDPVNVTIEAQDFADIGMDNHRAAWGGDDTAAFGNSPGKDVFTADLEEARMLFDQFGLASTVTARDFPSVHAQANFGADTAQLTGSIAAETFTAYPNSGTFTNGTKTLSVVDFYAVYAYGGAGYDTSEFHLQGDAIFYAFGNGDVDMANSAGTNFYARGGQF